MRVLRPRDPDGLPVLGQPSSFIFRGDRLSLESLLPPFIGQGAVLGMDELQDFQADSSLPGNSRRCPRIAGCRRPPGRPG